MERLKNFVHSVVGCDAHIEYPCCVLGTIQREPQQLDEHLENSFYLFTYRRYFDPLPYSTLTSDKGWGCLARATQMLLACSLRRHSAQDCKLQYFADLDDEQVAPFSLHCMVRHILKQGESLRPVYWAPSQGCEAISGCVKRATERGILSSPLSVVITVAGAVPAEEVSCHLKESRNVLILAPLRCGASRCMSQKMFLSLEHLLLAPESVGMVGGVPNRGYYIIGTGAQELLLYLDPHCKTQDALLSGEPGETGVVKPTSSNLRSVPYGQVDTSFFLGFFVDSQSRWESLQKRIEGLSKQKLHPIVSVYRGGPHTPVDSLVMEWPTEP